MTKSATMAAGTTKCFLLAFPDYPCFSPGKARAQRAAAGLAGSAAGPATGGLLRLLKGQTTNRRVKTWEQNKHHLHG